MLLSQCDDFGENLLTLDFIKVPLPNILSRALQHRQHHKLEKLLTERQLRLFCGSVESCGVCAGLLQKKDYCRINLVSNEPIAFQSDGQGHQVKKLCLYLCASCGQEFRSELASRGIVAAAVLTHLQYLLLDNRGKRLNDLLNRSARYSFLLKRLGSIEIPPTLRRVLRSGPTIEAEDISKMSRGLKREADDEAPCHACGKDVDTSEWKDDPYYQLSLSKYSYDFLRLCRNCGDAFLREANTSRPSLPIALNFGEVTVFVEVRN